ncbi:MAG: C4-dicarboxylate ABC transporter substrate-binding protein [Alphaproteobacteria bacterium]|nr:C4-dicarboxylate ABC transporter substrate-binding protein [Alphaproteobacteria bacterium]
MKRMLVAAAAALALVPIGAAAQTVQGPKVSWKIGAWGKPRAVTEGIELLARHVKERTGGNFTITIGYGTLGGEKELLDILSRGALEMTMICSSYHPDKQPAYTVLDLPFLPLPDPATQWRVHDAIHKHPFIVKEFEKWNASLYVSSLLPQYEFVGRSSPPPRKLADWKGLRVRAIGGIGEAMRNLGAVPTSVPASEVYTLMERGTVDAVSFPSTYAHQSNKTHEIGKWYTANLSPGTQACPALINRDHWAKLPDQYKALFDEAKPKIFEALAAAYKKADDTNIPLFRRRLEFVTYSEADLAEFRKAGAQPVWDAWVKERAAQGIPAKELLDLILKTAASGGKS